MKSRGGSEAAAKAVASIRHALISAIEELEAMTGDDRMIVAWDNGLGVKFTDCGPVPVSLFNATIMLDGREPSRPVFNGHNVQARLVTRGAAAVAYIPQLRASLEYMDKAECDA